MALSGAQVEVGPAVAGWLGAINAIQVFCGRPACGTTTEEGQAEHHIWMNLLRDSMLWLELMSAYKVSDQIMFQQAFLEDGVIAGFRCSFTGVCHVASTQQHNLQFWVNLLFA